MIIDNEEYKDFTEYINDKTKQNMNSIAKTRLIFIILLTIEIIDVFILFIIIFTKFRQIINTKLIIGILIISIISILAISAILSIINSIERNNQMIEVLHKKNEIEKKKDTK